MLPPKQKLVNEFIVYWRRRVEAGQSSALDRRELMSIDVFLDWLYTIRNDGEIHHASVTRDRP